MMTKLEELEAACEAARAAWKADYEAACDAARAACHASWNAYAAAEDAYKAELEKTEEENSDD
jgi:hypothetical protein